MAKDVLKDVIYKALIDDDNVVSLVGSRIKFYEYPDTGDVTGAYIVIDPLDVPTPSDFADNTWLTYDYLFQIDIWGKSRKAVTDLTELVLLCMWDKTSFRPYGGGSTPEYDSQTGIYRQSRNYRGKIYKGEKK